MLARFEVNGVEMTCSNGRISASGRLDGEHVEVESFYAFIFGVFHRHKRDWDLNASSRLTASFGGLYPAGMRMTLLEWFKRLDVTLT